MLDPQRYCVLHLAFAAHQSGYQPDRMHGGSAKGTVEIKNVQIAATGAHNSPPPSTIEVPADGAPATAVLVPTPAPRFDGQATQTELKGFHPGMPGWNLQRATLRLRLRWQTAASTTRPSPATSPLARTM